MGRKSLKPGALTAPLPPVLVTVGEGDAANIITIGWTGILATHPARTYVSIRPERHSYSLLRRHGEFVVNLATVEMARKVDYCGIYTGAKVNKFKECGLTPVASKEVTVPSIAECPLSLECRVVEVIPMGTHDVFIADIVGVSCDEAMLDDMGRLCYDKVNLLAYAHGEYFALGEKVGRFGFSTDKKKPAAKKPAGNKADKSTAKMDGEAKPTAKMDGEAKPAAKRPNGKKTDAPNGGRKSGDAPKPDTGRKATPKGESRKAEPKGENRSTEAPKGENRRAEAPKGDGHRPFYLDAPRGKRAQQKKKKTGRK